MPTRIIYSQRQWSLYSTFALLIGLFFTTIPNINKLKEPELVSWLLTAVTNVTYRTPIVKLNEIEVLKPKEVVKSVHNVSESFYIAAKVPELIPLRDYLQSKYEVSDEDAIDIIASVIKYSDQYKIAPDIILGLIRVESGFLTDAESNAGAMGLMQVMPKIHRKLVADQGGQLSDLRLPAFNIKIGTMILKQMIRASSGDMEDALARYNGSYGQNNGYADKVLAARYQFHKYSKYLKVA